MNKKILHETFNIQSYLSFAKNVAVELILDRQIFNYCDISDFSDSVIICIVDELENLDE